MTRRFKIVRENGLFRIEKKEGLWWRDHDYIDYPTIEEAETAIEDYMAKIRDDGVKSYVTYDKHGNRTL